MNAPQPPPQHLPPGATWNPRGRKNVARVTNAWYAVVRSEDLGARKPHKAQVLGVPLALWRGPGEEPCAVLDRCPHRNVPLSLGRVFGGQIECRYHGWRFDGQGKLCALPGLPIVQGTRLDGPGRCTDGYPALERDGFVFVWVGSRPPADNEQPFALPQLGIKGAVHIRRSMRVNGTLHSTLENILDVPHTAFLHGGLFRTAEKKNTITAVVTRRRDGVEAQFLGEPRPEGVVARVLSPSGGVVEHWDRFFLPGVAQVEYKIGKENHVLVTTMCTPVAETVTDMHTVLTIKTHLPVAPLAALAGPIAWRILAQDKEILEAQTATVDRFGTERFTSTPIDLLGPHILHLLKKAEQGALDTAIEREERVELQV
jgi:phenylpropionate dioxygenase-like ring-hydroxylating dioxygenase large terminal subunit